MDETPSSCPDCSAPLAAGARYCAYCGREAVAPPRPAEFHAVQPRYFGIPAGDAVFAVGAACLVLGVVLLALGYAISGALLLVAAAAFLALFASVARARPDGALARHAHRLAVGLRARTGYAAERLVAHGSARVAVARAQRELAGLNAERERRLRDLGASVYAGDGNAEELRGEIAELDRRITEKGEEMHALVTELEERLGRARLETQATEIQPTPPSPPQIPEPTPEPHRPPIPPDTPDPSPEPHTPPAPPQVPEPTPEPSIRAS